MLATLIWLEVVLSLTFAVHPWVRRTLGRDALRCRPGKLLLPGLGGFDVVTSKNIPGDQIIIAPNGIRLWDDPIVCKLHVDTTAFDEEMKRVRLRATFTHELLARVEDPRAFIIKNIGI